MGSKEVEKGFPGHKRFSKKFVNEFLLNLLKILLEMTDVLRRFNLSFTVYLSFDHDCPLGHRKKRSFFDYGKLLNGFRFDSNSNKLTRAILDCRQEENICVRCFSFFLQIVIVKDERETRAAHMLRMSGKNAGKRRNSKVLRSARNLIRTKP